MMNYWIIKGRKELNEWDKWLSPGRTCNWYTKRLPKAFTKGDRIFFWESAPSNRILGLGILENPHTKTDEWGRQLYLVRACSSVLKNTLTKSDLTQMPELNDAGFLKQGPAHSILSLREGEATALYAAVVARNSELRSVWSDMRLPEAEPLVKDTQVDDYEAIEGRPSLVEHLKLERDRDRNLPRRKKAEVLRQTGKLVCEACGFDFRVCYGSVAEGFCEAHHNNPLASDDGERKTSLSDLAILCSNCHRVIHLTDPMMNVKKFTSLVIRQRKLISKE